MIPGTAKDRLHMEMGMRVSLAIPGAREWQSDPTHMGMEMGMRVSLAIPGTARVSPDDESDPWHSNTARE